MAYGLIKDTTLTAIADAIRSKLGVSDLFTPEEMSDAINDILGYLPDWSEIGYTDTPQSIIDIFDHAKDIYDDWDPTDTSKKFSYDSNLIIFPLVDTHNYTDMSNFFMNCSKLMTVPLLDTSEVTNMNSMFYSCAALTTIPLLNTSKVTAMQQVFRSCSKLTEVPLLDTSEVTNMNSMFYGCAALTTIPLLNTSKVKNMGSMFYSCSNLTNVPLLDTSEVTDMTNLISTGKLLTDESLNNILQMCVNSGVTTNKKLSSLGFKASNYPASRIQALSNYQTFIDAGWTIGYS